MIHAGTMATVTVDIISLIDRIKMALSNKSEIPKLQLREATEIAKHLNLKRYRNRRTIALDELIANIVTTLQPRLVT